MRPRKKTNLIPRLNACASMILSNPTAQKGRLREAFPNPSAPLHLEIGCGKGAFICQLAQRNPDINFIAMEREPNVAVIAVERAMRAEPPLPNLRFLLDDAEKLPEMFEPEELERIYINFCDPWHKRLQFKTDNYMLYHFSTFEFAAILPAYFTTTDLHNSEAAASNIMTEYETYFSNLGQPIYAIRARRQD